MTVSQKHNGKHFSGFDFLFYFTCHLCIVHVLNCKLTPKVSILLSNTNSPSLITNASNTHFLHNETKVNLYLHTSLHLLYHHSRPSFPTSTITRSTLSRLLSDSSSKSLCITVSPQRTHRMWNQISRCHDGNDSVGIVLIESQSKSR